MLACFNTCVGLIACVGEYFHTLLPRIPYPALAAFFAAASMLIANLGLADILRLSVPVLNALPLAALGFGWVLPAVIGLLAGIFLSCTEE